MPTNETENIRNITPLIRYSTNNQISYYYYNHHTLLFKNSY